MSILKNQINTWIFDLDNTLYSADSGIFQQVHELMGKYVSEKLKLDINKAKELQKKYFIKHGTTLRGLMDNHDVDPDDFLKEVHKLDYSIVRPNIKLNEGLTKLKGKKIIYTNANLEHVNNILSRISDKTDLKSAFDQSEFIFVVIKNIFPFKTSFSNNNGSFVEKEILENKFSSFSN